MRFTPHQTPSVTLFFIMTCWESVCGTGFSNSGVRILLKDERTGEEELFAYEGGLRAFVEFLNHSKTPIAKVCHFQAAAEDGVEVEVALQWNDGFRRVYTATQ
ncbi:MAG: hypothetical protein CM15mP74_13520 [Halieaceae bacterium]|nr:MAG: hypothetical protein CM15mP74_13520 [Halieaceae bacterium]